MTIDGLYVINRFNRCCEIQHFSDAARPTCTFDPSGVATSNSVPGNALVGAMQPVVTRHKSYQCVENHGQLEGFSWKGSQLSRFRMNGELNK